MEHVSTVLSRTLPDLQRHARPSALASAIASRAHSLFDLVRQFEARESLENEDVVAPLASLHMTADGMIYAPGRGCFAFTDWSKRQCASLLGIRWDRWFANCPSPDLAFEINRRFARSQGDIRLRTARGGADAEPGADGILRAFVSPGYTAIADSRIAGLIATALSSVESELPIIRVDQTDRTTSYVVGVGRPYRIGGPGDVGDVWGGLLIRNSGVGFASLLISLHLTRLLCKNGMVAPLPDAIVVRRRHRSFDGEKLRGVLVERLRELPGKLARGADLLSAAATRALPGPPESAIRGLLERAGLPLRLALPILDAYRREPHPSAFGISQAVTLASQSFAPEERFELERAAGEYLAD